MQKLSQKELCERLLAAQKREATYLEETHGALFYKTEKTFPSMHPELRCANDVKTTKATILNN